MASMNNPDDLLKTIRGIRETTWSRQAIPLATHASMASSKWTLGLLENLDDPQLREQIEDLSRRQDNPNPFFELPILEPSARYLQTDHVQFLYLSERISSHEELKLFAPVRLEKSPFFRRPLIRVWSHKYAPLGQPLIDKRETEAIVEAFVNCLRSPNSSQPAVMLFEDLPTQTGFFQNLEKSQAFAETFHEFSQFERAGFFPVEDKTYEDAHVSGKRRRRMCKARERLEAKTSVEFSCYSSYDKIMPALEDFLALETKGWKGDRGTALAQNQSVADCTRLNVSNMANLGQCRMFALEGSGKTLASLIVYHSNGYYFPWKIAFDQDYEKYSVGNLLVHKLNQTLSQDKGFRGLDSLASPANQTALRFWPDRIAFCSLAIGIGDGGGELAKKVARELNLQAAAKTRLKHLLRR